jgi:hypothetical protein
MKGDLPIVHRAIFGDVRGAHNLVAASTGAPEPVLSDLASKYTDRLLPTEVPWIPYTCGFPLRECYVVTRTFSVKATRSGMVETHAAMVPLQSVDSCTLSSLLQLLPNEPRSSPSAPIDTATFDPHADDGLSSMPSGYPSVVRLLLEGPVPVWLGQEGFEETVSFLWRNLWSAARRNLRFRVSAELNDLIDWPASLVCTPKGLRANWNEQHFVDQTATALHDPSMCEAYLLALPAGRELADARARLQFSPASITGLKRLEQYIKMGQTDTADSIRAAVRLLNAMAPHAEQMRDEKESVFSKLVHKTIDGTENDVLGLRNLDISGFATAPQGLRHAIAAWLRVRVAETSGGTHVAKAILLTNHPWKHEADAALSDAFESWTRKHAALLWHWWSTEPALVTPSEILLPKQVGDAERDLASTMPTVVGKDLRDPVLAMSMHRGWYLLHGAVLVAAPDLTTLEKFRRQIEVEAVAQNLSGLQLIADNVEVSEMLSAALELKDARLLTLTGQAAAQVPALMANIDASSSAWRAIWNSYIQAGRQPFEGIAQPTVAAHALMDALLAGSTIPGELLERIASDAQTDLAMYARRRDLWRVLEPAVAGKALQIAAHTWLARFLADPTFDPQRLETELQDAVIACWRSSLSLATATSLPSLWDRFSALLTEADFLNWVATHSEPLTKFEATAIGRLVSQHRWANAAKELAKRLRYGRSDLGAAVHECSSLLGFWDRWYVTLFTPQPVVTVDEWWNAWFELSIRLYSRGVEDNNIWTDADGEVSRVRQGTGREQWGHALDLLRKGGAGGTMTVEGLLHEMRKDFQANSELAQLESIYLSQIRTL